MNPSSSSSSLLLKFGSLNREICWQPELKLMWQPDRLQQVGFKPKVYPNWENYRHPDFKLGLEWQKGMNRLFKGDSKGWIFPAVRDARTCNSMFPLRHPPAFCSLTTPVRISDKGKLIQHVMDASRNGLFGLFTRWQSMPVQGVGDNMIETYAVRNMKWSSIEHNTSFASILQVFCPSVHLVCLH